MKQLNVLGGAPKGANVRRIYGFYKSNEIGGVAIKFNVKDEAAAKEIYTRLYLAELNYKTNLPEGNIRANFYKWQLENKDAFIVQVGNEAEACWHLLANIWLLEKENLMTCDDFNGVKFISEKLSETKKQRK